MIKAIIFDLDGMIIEEKDLFSKSFSKKYGIVWETVLEFFFNEYKQCLVGEADVKKEFEKYLKKWKLEKVTWEDVAKLWFDENVVFQHTFTELLGRLRKGGIICVLASNNEVQKKEYMIEKFDFGQLFDHIIFSCDVKAKKPKPVFIEFLLNEIGVSKEDVLFCDDKEENISELMKQGFQTYTYSNFREFVAYLESHGLLEK